MIGKVIDLIYFYLYLGLFIKILIELVEGWYYFCKIFCLVKNFIIIYGIEFLKWKDSLVFINVSRFIGKYSVVYLNNYNGFNILYNNIG